MKFVPDAVAMKVARQVLVTKKNSPALLFAAGLTGIVTSTVLACKATLRLEEVLDDAASKMDQAKELRHSNHPNYSEADYQKDVAYLRVRNGVAICKLYGPPVILGVLSISALVGSHNILSKRNAALGAAYAALEKGFNEYRQRVIDDIGEERERELRYDIRETNVIDHDSQQVVPAKIASKAGASVYARFFDEHSTQWKRNADYNKVFLVNTQRYLNDKLQHKGHMFLNEVYDALGLERTSAGSLVGWVVGNGDNFIDLGFSRNTEDNRRFMNGLERSVMLDFNVDGVIYNLI